MPGPLLTLFLVLAVAPALPGLATRTRALLTGRRGAPVLQLYRDLGKLIRKNVVYSRTTTPVFRIAPIVVLASVVVAATLLPLDGHCGAAAAFAATWSRSPAFSDSGDSPSSWPGWTRDQASRAWAPAGRSPCRRSPSRPCCSA